MSLDAQDWVWEHSASKGTARLVLLAIADKANGRDCSAYAGTAFLVRRTRAARSSVVVAVDRLLESGELEVVEGRKGPKGETWYRLPQAKGHHRQGGPESGPVQNPDPSENRTPRGTKSGPPRSENRTPTGPESGPQNACNAFTRMGTQREGSPRGSKRTPQAPQAAPHSLIPPTWQPTPADHTAAAADTRRLGPTGTAAATAKFVRHHQAKATRAADFGPLWVSWLARERPDNPQQGAFLVGLPGGAETPPTPTPPSFRQRMAELDAHAEADRVRDRHAGETG